jgi:uncharacterized membrane protein HdeD (DUF308 family)
MAITGTGTGTAREDLRSIGRLVLTHALARNWWLLMLRGVIGVVFGVVALFWPGITGRVGEKASRWWLAATGIAGIAAGVIAWVMPGATALALLILVAAWAIVTGAMQVWGAIRLRKEIEGEWLLGLSGSLSILLGIILLLQPAAGALAVVWWIGAFAIIMGLVYIGLALKLRKHAHLED